MSPVKHDLENKPINTIDLLKIIKIIKDFKKSRTILSLCF